MKLVKGFTIIELLISIFVLTVGILGILLMFPTAIRVEKSSQMASIASYLGQAKIEQIISQPYDEIASSTEDYGVISGFQPYKRITEINYFDPVNSTTTGEDLGIKKIDITVFWQPPFGITEKCFRIDSLVTKR